MAPKRKAATKTKAASAKAKAGAKKAPAKKAKKSADDKKPKVTEAAVEPVVAKEDLKKDTVVTPEKPSVPEAAVEWIFEVLTHGESKVYMGDNAAKEVGLIFQNDPAAVIIQHKSLSDLARSQAEAREKRHADPVSNLQPFVKIKKEPGVDDNVETTVAPGDVAILPTKPSPRDVTILPTKPPAIEKKANVASMPSVAEASIIDDSADKGTGGESSGPYYVVQTGTDTRVFTGVEAKDNLIECLQNNPGASFEQFDDYSEVQANISGSPRGKFEIHDGNADGKPSARVDPSSFIYHTPGRSGETSTVKSVGGSAPSMVVGGSARGASKPNIQQLVQSEASSSFSRVSKIDIIVSNTPFIEVSPDGHQGVVFVHFGSGKGDNPKSYWAAKPNVMGSILSSLDESGHYSHDTSLPVGIFKDVNVAEMRCFPHGPNEGQRSKKNSNYMIEIMYIVVRLAKSSLINAEEIVHRIGRRVKTIVSEDWFKEMYLQMSEAHVSTLFKESLSKPKEEFFTLLKRSNVTYHQNIALDHYLLDDVIGDYVSDHFGLGTSPVHWPEAVKMMAYKDGETPGANKSG